MYDGFLSNIPKGWALCDGTNGTPNLISRFIMGTATQGQIGETGGANFHQHDFDSNNHLHLISPGAAIAENPNEFNFNTDSQIATGTTFTATAVPPFFKLAYIKDTGII